MVIDADAGDPDLAQREIFQRWLALSQSGRVEAIRRYTREVYDASRPHTPERRTGRGRRQVDQEV